MEHSEGADVPDKKFELGEYVEVKDRIKLFYELYAGGRLVTSKVEILTAPDGKQRVMVKAKAYRSVDDPLPGKGTSWMELPGTTSFTRGSEVENAETSAWGRAIGSLGILIDKSIASANEIQNKDDEGRSGIGHVPVAPLPPVDATDGLIGTVEVGKPPVDLEKRQTPDGPAFGFKLKNGRKSYPVLAVGPLAEALSLSGLKPDERVTVYGSIDMVPWDKDGKAMPPYARVNPTKVATADWILPADVTEAESVPAFSADELADIE